MNNKKQIIRKAHGTGLWFPADPVELKSIVRGGIGEANHLPPISNRIIAAIAPHAGFVYSGRIAGATFRALKDNANNKDFTPETAVIIGFTHKYPLSGIAILDGDAISTPLGTTDLDMEGANILIKNSKIIRFDAKPHAFEHSAENEVPFTQFALPDTKIILVLMGDHSNDTIAELVSALITLASKKKIVVIASTDLLHDPDYDKVTATDKKTLEIITSLDDKKLMAQWTPDHQVCCGIGPVITAMRFARQMGSKKGITLMYRNSGDDFPDSRGRWVVGYGAVVFPQ